MCILLRVGVCLCVCVVNVVAANAVVGALELISVVAFLVHMHKSHADNKIINYLTHLAPRVRQTMLNNIICCVHEYAVSMLPIRFLISSGFRSWRTHTHTHTVDRCTAH